MSGQATLQLKAASLAGGLTLRSRSAASSYCSRARQAFTTSISARTASAASKPEGRKGRYRLKA